MKPFRFLLLLFVGTILPVSGQETYPIDGLRHETPSIHAFVNGVIVVKPGQTLAKDAVLLIRDGKVEAVGAGVSIPPDAVVHDLKGLWIYPGLIDPFSDFGSKPQNTETSKRPRPTTLAWNPAVSPEFRMSENLEFNAKKAAELRSLGFTTVHARSSDGIFRGTGTVITLGEKTQAEETLVADATVNLSFDKGSSSEPYPSSLMGAIALMRQTFLDAAWYRQASVRKAAMEPNLSLEALNSQLDKKLPILFEVANTQDVFRTAVIGKEFGFRAVIKGGGREYERAKEIKQLGATLILPLDYPMAIDLSNPDDAVDVSLRELRHWELAPTNAVVLSNEKIPIAFTTSGLKDLKVFWKNIQKSMSFGLTSDQALEALTTTPARILGIDKMVGTLEKGKSADFVVTSGNLFNKGTAVYENWIRGMRYVASAVPDLDIRGTYELSFIDRTLSLEITGPMAKPSAKIFLRDSSTIGADLILDGDNVLITFAGDSLGNPGLIRLNGVATGTGVKGIGNLPSGRSTNWTAQKTKIPELKVEDQSVKPDSGELSSVTYPNLAFGWGSQPRQETLLIKNATIWTNSEKGVLNGGDILIENGRIKAVGKNLTAGRGVSVIDGTGHHVTPGIIDEHSHIAVTRGVNEGTQAVSAEVRIGDALDGEDIDIYRQLAGGVTTSHILHGSANPIGGQTQVIKLRWGLLPEQLKLEPAPAFIKFALGENVKQSNWGDHFRTRYPQTRIGVEQLIKDEFVAAKAYKKRWTQYRNAGGEKSNMPPPRTDLELEAMVEILDGKRNITCHSYVQSEITMLLRLAEETGFKVNTFTHILEGYKVADKMKKHGAAGSTFSDWWAYKFEVYDAIPYNGALMHEQGVTVAFNSDDAEMGRRLNQEAAKAVKYGGVSEEEALKFVTLNPAKMLHIDDRVGSLKPGMDADVVLWNDHPLSVYAKVLKTFVDGRVYYDSEEDAQLLAAIKTERARLIQKMIREKKTAGGGESPAKQLKQRYGCDDLDSDYNMGGN